MGSTMPTSWGWLPALEDLGQRKGPPALHPLPK